MPYEIEYTQTYEKKLFKFLKKHKDIVPRYKKTILLMEADPFHPSNSNYTNQTTPIQTNQLKKVFPRLKVI